jgi:hypothetical protein
MIEYYFPVLNFFGDKTSYKLLKPTGKWKIENQLSGKFTRKILSIEHRFWYRKCWKLEWELFEAAEIPAINDCKK